MNAVDAVEALGAARAPSATLQALAEAVAAIAPAEEAVMPPATTTTTTTTDVPTATTTATALNPGHMTLGQLAAEQAALRATPEAAAGEAARHALAREPLADAGAMPPLAGLLAVPVLLNPLQPPAPPPARPDAGEPPPRRIVRRPREDADDRAPPPPPPEAGPAPSDDADEPAPPEAAALHDLLAREGPPEARAELARGRRVLLVLPEAAAGRGVVPAAAWLLGAGRAQRFGARWWPGAAEAATPRWLHWRLFRDGDPLLARGLASRAGGPPCRVRLGAAPQGLADADSALLALADRIRFAQSLGGQWSVLLIAAPPARAR